MKAQITLKSGAQIDADVNDISAQEQPISGRFVGLVWSHPDQTPARRLIYLDAGEVAAVVTFHEAGGGAA